MQFEGFDVPAGTQLRADVCIIGSGPAGLTVADGIDRATGGRVSIALLESGAREPSGPGRALARTRSTGYPYYPVEDVHCRALGGNSHVWTRRGPRARPLDGVDFEVRPGVPHSGWPFGDTALAGYYAQAAERMRIADRYTAAAWERSGHRPWDLGPTGTAEFYSTVFQFGDGRSFLEVADRLAPRPNVTLVTNATVLSLVTDEAGTGITQARVAATGTPSRFSVSARLFVVCSGGIATPQLLLNSNERHPRGIGNDHDLVGRYFSDHLGLRCGVVVAGDAMKSRQLAASSSFYRSNSANKATGEPGWQGMLSPTRETLLGHRLLNSAWWLVPLPTAMTTPAAHAMVNLERAVRFRPRPRGVARSLLRAAVTPRAAVAVFQHRNERSGTSRPDLLQLKVMAEQAPNPESRVTLSDRRGDRDEHGSRRASLHWRISSLDVESIKSTQDLIDRSLRRAGIGNVHGLMSQQDVEGALRASGPLLHGHEHQLGTTRMATDARKGVVDEDCRVHSTTNLFIAGGSVMPTIGHANPTLTVTALALRLADHLASHLQKRASLAPLDPAAP